MADANKNKKNIKDWARNQRRNKPNLNWDLVNDGMINSVLNNILRVRSSPRGVTGGTVMPIVSKAQQVILQQLQKLSKKSARESRNDEYQWVIVKRERGVYSIVPIQAQGYAVQNWKLNYVFNESFPSVKLTALANNKSESFLHSVFVSSKPCKTTNSNAAGVCGNSLKWYGSNYKVLKSGLFKRVIVKKGAASPGVANLATLIKSAGAVSIPGVGQVSAKVLRARYLEAKRNGDYFQIFTCFKVNNDDDVFIMKPGSEDLANQIGNDSSGQVAISSAGINMMKQLFAVDKFYFDKCCFWTCDRPAGFFAMLMGVPIIKKAVNVGGLTGTKLNYIPNDEQLRIKIDSVIQGVLELTISKTAKDCIIEILTDWRNDTEPITLESLHRRQWYLKMCIFDTCHDFGHGNRSPKQLVELIKNVLISFGLVRNLAFINNVFSSIVDMEKIADIVIQRVASMTSNSYSYGPDVRTGVYDILVNDFNSKKMCYVYDCGTTPPVTHPFRLFRALLAAKLYDPSS